MKAIWGIVAALVVLAVFYVTVRNGLIDKDETVKEQWKQIETQLQRRADLIPNLVNTVKGYATHEQETLQGVIEARAKATSTTIDPSNVTPEQMAAFQQNQSGLSSALSKLMVVVEKYPDLKANQNFLELQSQLEGTENRINVERNRYNGLVKDYNVLIRKFPGKLLAGMFDFDSMVLFKAAEGSEKAPSVEF